MQLSHLFTTFPGTKRFSLFHGVSQDAPLSPLHHNQSTLPLTQFGFPQQEKPHRSVKLIFKRHAAVAEQEYGREEALLTQDGIDATIEDARAYVQQLKSHPEKNIHIVMFHSPLRRCQETAFFRYNTISQAIKAGELPHVTITYPHAWQLLDTTALALHYYMHHQELPKHDVVTRWISDTDTKEVTLIRQLQDILFDRINVFESFAANTPGVEDIEMVFECITSETTHLLLLHRMQHQGISIPGIASSNGENFGHLKIAHLQELLIDLKEAGETSVLFEGRSYRLPHEGFLE